MRSSANNRELDAGCHWRLGRQCLRLMTPIRTHGRQASCVAPNGTTLPTILTLIRLGQGNRI